MFKKLNIKILLIILVILAGVVVIINLTGKKERTFKSKVLDFNPDMISAMLIYNPKNVSVMEVNMQNDDSWDVQYEGQSYSADKNAILNMLHMLNNMKTERIAATSEAKWDDYHVTEEKGIRVELLQEQKVIADLMIGKFSYKMNESADPRQQQRAKMTSYVRYTDEDEVYAIDGILRMNFTSGVEFFRNKELIGKNHDELMKVSFSYPDQTFTLERSGTHWLLEGQLVDSTTTYRFIRSIARIRSSDFINDVNLASSQSLMSMRVEGPGFDPIDIHAYPSDDTAIQYYITSTFNDGTVFDGKKGKLLGKIFVQPERFLRKSVTSPDNYWE